MIDDPATDASTSEICTFTPDNLHVPVSSRPDTGCSRPVWEAADSSRCVWHAYGADKPPDELAATVGDGELSGARAQDSDLTKVSFPEDSRFIGADLAGANLQYADLSEGVLRYADLSEAELQYSDLSRADLASADLPRADLRGAELTKTILRGADMADTNLIGAELDEADLVNTSLVRSLLLDTSLSEAVLSRRSDLATPDGQIKRYDKQNNGFFNQREEMYDAIARANHELRTAYSANGLTHQARRARVRERAARRKEAFAEGGWRGTAAGLGSYLSQVVAGYGVQLRWIGLMMLLLYLVSAGVYSWEGMPPDRALYYSVVTFTTSPPETPPLGIASIMAGIETFAGTAFIVLLGYVLATREQV